MDKNNSNIKVGWTVVGEYSSLSEAAIVKGMLETNGIPAVINDEIISSVYPMTATWAPIRLYVRDSDIQAADMLISGNRR